MESILVLGKWGFNVLSFEYGLYVLEIMQEFNRSGKLVLELCLLDHIHIEKSQKTILFLGFVLRCCIEMVEDKDPESYF